MRSAHQNGCNQKTFLTAPFSLFKISLPVECLIIPSSRKREAHVLDSSRRNSRAAKILNKNERKRKECSVFPDVVLPPEEKGWRARWKAKGEPAIKMPVYCVWRPAAMAAAWRRRTVNV
jgi:hypothetical protein